MGVTLKPKVVLKAKEEVFIPVTQLMCTLNWTSDVDLDLMAFYTTKGDDGKVGGVFTSHITGGSMGDLNAPPFMQLSGDAGVGAQGGENEEVLRIAKLENIKELYLVALNYTDAINGSEKTFSNYNGKIAVVGDADGSNFECNLDAATPGVAAVICKIDNTNALGAKLINVNEVMSLEQLVASIPGASALTKQ